MGRVHCQDCWQRWRILGRKSKVISKVTSCYISFASFRCLEETEHRLDEWLDWSEGEVGRKLVGESSVSATFARIMAKCKAGGFSQPQVQEAVEIEDEEDVTVVARQEKKRVNTKGIGGQSPSIKQGQSQGSRQGSILSYFTAGKSQKQACTEIADQVEVVDLESEDIELMLPIIHEEVTPCETREGAVDPLKRGPELLEPAEAELLDSLFDFDSGYDSPTKPTFGELPDLDHLLLEPCSKEEIEEMMAEARKRYLWPPEEALEVHAFPMEEVGRVPLKSDNDDSLDMFALEQDMSGDMFHDGSAVECNYKDTEEEAARPDPEVADFNLSSPEVDDEVIDEQVGNDQSKEEMFPEVSQDMFAASFDLGSPLVEGGEMVNDVVDEKKAPTVPSSPLFDLGSPLLEGEEVEDKECAEKPSSPLFDLGSPLLEDEGNQEEKDRAMPSPSLFDLGSPLIEDEAGDRKLEEAAAASPSSQPVPLSAASTPLPGLLTFLKHICTICLLFLQVVQLHQRCLTLTSLQ